jgi:mannose-6-phosphate isomerase-like protein (cupin superfamily)
MLRFLLALPLVCNAGDTDDMPNFFHYMTGDGANFDSKQSVGDGVTLFKWKGTAAGIADMRKGVCAHNVLEWDAGSSTPYPTGSAWHSYDTVYFVAQGNVTITVEGVTKTMKTGDTVWIQAGVNHSSLVPVDNKVGALVDALITPYEPKLTTPPSFAPAAKFPPPSPSPGPSNLKHRFYMASEDLTPPDVEKIQGPNDHYEWYGSGSDPDVLHVWWKPNSNMPCHSHAEGALYVPAWGEMCFSGETSGGGCRKTGEARWTKPGYEYSTEKGGPKGSEIIVMNIKSNPSMCWAMV